MCLTVNWHRGGHKLKKKRHELILRLITENTVTTQDELLELLKKNGYNVTQATVSRDIKELKLIATTIKNIILYILHLLFESALDKIFAIKRYPNKI
jgi:arginine repressor